MTPYKKKKKHVWKKVVVGLVIVSILVILVVKHFLGGGKSTEIKTVKVKIGNVAERLTETGNIELLRTVEVKSKIAGTVQQILVREGDEVKSGDVLCIIDPDPTQTLLLFQKRSSVDRSRINLDQAKKEFLTRFKLSLEVLEEGLELQKEEDFELAIRFTKEFYEQNKEFIRSLATLFNKPSLVEMWDDRFFYFTLKWEFNFIDNQEKASALSTDQIDVENAQRYGITYVNDKGKKQHPLILHCCPSGAIERCVYALLEKAYRRQQEGKTPLLPLWLSPTQVRIVPLSERFTRDSEKLMEEIERNPIRVDVDDRPITMRKKVREAEREWINYILVIGEKEANSSTLQVRDRKAGKMRGMQLRELIGEIKEATKGKPFKALTLPKKLSERLQFSF